jgi:dTDP-glucose pyrophosphorylase/CBS domain-containing protein
VAFNPDAFCLTASRTLGEIMTLMERNASGIALLVDEELRLVATVTDGDIRRAFLGGCGIDDSARRLLESKAHAPAPHCARAGQSAEEMAAFMRAKGIRHLPVLDGGDRVVDMVFLESLRPETRPQLNALIMAGGFGVRLRPLTDCLPKPMLPIGGKPLLEIIINRLRKAGIRKVFISIHYLAEKIVDHFGTGEDFGVSISYIREETPLGTAGAIGLLPPSDIPLLVINGDVLTAVDFNSMSAFHAEHASALTVAVRDYRLQIPYGVLHCEGYRVRAFLEKPSYSYLTNAGLYILGPQAARSIAPNQRVDMPELIDRLVAEDKPVCCFPIIEYWQDIGSHSEYNRAIHEVSCDTAPSLF